MIDSIAKIKPLAFGRKSTIYAIDSKTVLKLYNKRFSKVKIQREFDNTKAVLRSHKIPVSKPIKFVTINDQLGIVYERIYGISLMDLFMKNPLTYFTYGKLLADIHKEIHATRVTGIVNQEERFGDMIRKSSRLSDDEKNIVMKTLTVKYNPVLCHGDFHHGNIIETSQKEYYVLDWMDAFVGDYLLDVNLTAVNAMVSDAPDHVSAFYRRAYEVLKKILSLDARYLQLYGVLDNGKVKDYIVLAAAIHLINAEKNKMEIHRNYLSYLMGK